MGPQGRPPSPPAYLLHISPLIARYATVKFQRIVFHFTAKVTVVTGLTEPDRIVRLGGRFRAVEYKIPLRNLCCVRVRMNEK